MQGNVNGLTKVDSIGKYKIYRVTSNVYTAGKYIPEESIELFTVPFTSVSHVRNYILNNEECICLMDFAVMFLLWMATD